MRYFFDKTYAFIFGALMMLSLILGGIWTYFTVKMLFWSHLSPNNYIIVAISFLILEVGIISVLALSLYLLRLFGQTIKFAKEGVTVSFMHLWNYKTPWNQFQEIGVGHGSLNSNPNQRGMSFKKEYIFLSKKSLTYEEKNTLFDTVRKNRKEVFILEYSKDIYNKILSYI